MNREERISWDKKEFEDIHEIIKNKDSLSHYDFLRIRNFKIQNSSPEKEEHIKEITKKAFEIADKNILAAITLLSKELDGVGVPVASAILAMKYPEKFCIIDWRVIDELGETEKFKGYLNSPEIYERYLLLMREKAKNEKKGLREFERELFERSIKKSLNNKKRKMIKK